MHTHLVSFDEHSYTYSSSASVAWQSLLLALTSIDGHLHSPLIGYLCKSLRIISLVWPTRLIFLAVGEVLSFVSFGFNLAVSFPSDSRGSKARILLLPSRITRWGFHHIA